MPRRRKGKSKSSGKPRKRGGKRRSGGRSRGGRFSKTDSFGNSFGGTIRPISGQAEATFSPKPGGPTSGADFSTAQQVRTFAGGAGSAFANATGTAYAFLSAQAGANGYFVLPFEIGDLDQVTTLAGLFDQYRIDKVEVKLLPESNAINEVNGTAAQDVIPILTAVLDFDDANTPTSLAYTATYDNAQSVVYGQGGLFITVKPAFTPALYSGGVFDGYEVERAGWVDFSNTSVPHFGIKGSISTLNGASTQEVNWYILAKYFISCRNTR